MSRHDKGRSAKAGRPFLFSSRTLTKLNTHADDLRLCMPITINDTSPQAKAIQAEWEKQWVETTGLALPQTPDGWAYVAARAGFTPAEIKQIAWEGDEYWNSAFYPVLLGKLETLKESLAKQTKSTNSDDGMLTHVDFAKRYGIPQEVARKRLARWRKANPGGNWTEVEYPKPREPRYLYRLSAVRHLFEAV
jgi:hypothetical protein